MAENTARAMTIDDAPLKSFRLVGSVLDSAHECGLAHEVLEPGRITEKYPQHALNAGEIAVHEEAAGVLLPEAAIRAAARRAQALGATLHTNTAVEAVEEVEGGVEVRAGGRAYRVRRAVTAVGSWLGKLLPDLRLPLTVERQVLAWFSVEELGLYRPERCPIYVYQEDENWTWYGFPSLGGRTVKAAVHRHGSTVDPDGIDREVRQEDAARISRFAGERLGGLARQPVRAKVCMYTNTPDEDFVVGPAPGRPNLILLGGFSGHGFKLAPMVGEIAADLATDGETPHPIKGFSPRRFATSEQPTY